MGAALVGCGPEGPGVGGPPEGAGLLIGGAPTAGDPAVVALSLRRVRCEDPLLALCTGTLVGPREVLTAAHCVADERGSWEVEVFAGADTSGPGALARVVEVAVHPAWDPDTAAFDAALLRLDRALAADPVPLPTGDLSDLPAGAPLRAVGFGVSARDAEDPGVKREGLLALGAVAAASFEAGPSPAMTCVGDSGGPVFAELDGVEQLVGITVRGDLACEALAVQVRVDALVAGFVAPFLAAGTAPPEPGWIAVDGVCDADCAVDADCPVGLRCQPLPDGSRCTAFGLAPGDLGPRCDADDACGTGVCARVAPDGPDACLCHAPCESAPALPRDSGPGAEPPGGCGCSVWRGGGGGPWALVGLLAALWGRRSR